MTFEREVTKLMLTLVAIGAAMVSTVGVLIYGVYRFLAG